MWSSWPWVSTMASTRSLFSRRYSMSGRTRSMPGISVPGNDSPASMSRIRPPMSRTAMFRPTSPSPPRKARRGGAEPAGAPERSPVTVLLDPRLGQELLDPGSLLGGGGQQRQARLADGAAHDVEDSLD